MLPVRATSPRSTASANLNLRQSARRLAATLLLSALGLLGGCQLFADDADREVYAVVRERQSQAIGIQSSIDLGRPEVPGRPPGQAYDFVPSPIGPDVPEEFTHGVSIEELTRESRTLEESEPSPQQTDDEQPPDEQPAAPEDEESEPAPAHEDDTAPGEGERAQEQESEPPLTDDNGPPPEDESAPAETGDVAGVEAEGAGEEEDELGARDVGGEDLDFGPPMTLPQALSYAVRHARDYVDAQEDLYLEALDLTLERHLWTPLFVSTLSADYTEFPDEEFRANPDGPDRALDAVADLAVTQRLPYGGEVVAQWIGTMMRDLENHVTTGESGSAILSANIPLLRGAGPVAYEGRYQAERDLIYAVRDFEDFRREFLTSIAGQYFDLLSSKSTLINSVASQDSARDTYLRSRAMARAEKVSRVDVIRALNPYLTRRNQAIAQVQAHETLLDRFKIAIGMPIEERMDAVDEDLDLTLAEVDEATAIATALVMRLDLITIRDRLDDAARRVENAKNGLLPDLNVRGGVRWGTQPDHLSMFDFRDGNDTWNVGVDLGLPLDRKAERNALRAAMIAQQRAERNVDLAEEQVRLDVRDALRTIRRTQASLDIQARSVEINEIQKEIAELRYRQGQSDNRDLVDAENMLLDAKNIYSQELSNLRQAVLNLRLQTGTLRVDDDGQWVDF